LLYHEDLTPPDYEPPGFVSDSSSDLNTFMGSSGLSYNFGTANIGTHNVSVFMKTSCDMIEGMPETQVTANILDSAIESVKELTDIMEHHHTPDLSPDILKGVSLNPKVQNSAMQLQDIALLSSIRNPEILQPGFATTQPIILDSKHENTQQLFTLQDSQAENFDKVKAFAENTNNKPTETSVNTDCICGLKESDLAMLFCDFCKTWQHTVCCGYFTNNDKRLPEGPYRCLTCQYRGKPGILRFCCKLAQFRRALYITYHEGIESAASFGDRVGVPQLDNAGLLRRLLQEKFIEKIPKDESVPMEGRSRAAFRYHVARNADVKRKLKIYFSTDLSIFRGFNYYMRNPNSVTAPVDLRLVTNLKDSPKRKASSASDEESTQSIKFMKVSTGRDMTVN
jgi:PHD-finger